MARVYGQMGRRARGEGEESGELSAPQHLTHLLLCCRSRYIVADRQGNKHITEERHADAVEFYTRAISLDSKKTVYFSNRAVALNLIGDHAKAEQDCKYILSKDGKNGKAFYQRAVARKGLKRWREAESDLKEVLRYQPGNDSAKKLMGIVKAEVAKLPKQTAKDVMDF